MIKLNLLPKELRTLQNRKLSFDIYSIIRDVNLIPVIIGILLFLVLIHGILAWAVISKKADLKKLSLEYAALFPSQQKARVLKAQVLALDDKISVIETLSEGGIFWPKKLQNLSNAMVDGVWLNLLYLKLQTDRDDSVVPVTGTPVSKQGDIIQRQVLVLEGSAVASNGVDETAMVGMFIKSLKEQDGFFDDFEDIKLFSIERESIGNIEIMNFVINCYFKKGYMYFEKLNV